MHYDVGDSCSQLAVILERKFCKLSYLIIMMLYSCTVYLETTVLQN
jgi:hypothetical protein